MSSPAAAFYFDLASPLAYLASERVLHAFSDPPTPVEWRPVLASGLPAAERFEAFRCREEQEAFREEQEAFREEQEAFREELARRARSLGLQPLRWPDPFPFDSAMAMRVATYAKSIGRAVPFAQAAFRQAFAGGRSLADTDSVLIAAAACEMHPAAVLRGAELRSVAEQLAASTAEAAAAGVRDVPAIVVGETAPHSEPRPDAGRRVFLGERAIEDAAAHMRSMPTAARAR